MSKKKQSINYLDLIPQRAETLRWHTDEATGLITLEVENTGVFNTIAQKVFHKPRTTQVHLDETDALQHAERVLLYLTGRERVEHLDTIGFLPGALADNLTSFGGVLDGSHGQMTVLSWIDAGATASYGTTSEPCAHLQKFPDPQALLVFYVQGATALEAYWKSVAWPAQGVFIGDPLAAPYRSLSPFKAQ